MSVIPTIDLATDSAERQAELIKHALSSVGFFAVQGAGPSVGDTAAVFEYVSK
jgi:isopenicillin N synthase-like dioxygenase